MKLELTMLGLVIVCANTAVVSAQHRPPTSNPGQLPPIETFFLPPINLENVSVWAPAAKTGPDINHSCTTRRNRPYSSVLPAAVDHNKTELCPDEVARVLAEYAACYHEQSMPLTIFNGWQWEYSYNLCQFNAGTYDLPGHGGFWECSWEAILTESAGSIGLQCLPIPSSAHPPSPSQGIKQKSNIEVRTFSFMRTRDGYPKERDL